MFYEQNSGSKQSHWIPLSDMMTGLMCVFLLISLICIIELQSRAKVAIQLAQDFQGARTDLANDFNKNFANESSKYGGIYLGNTDFRFTGNTFLTGSYELNESFKHYLNNFFPKYLSILLKEQFKKYIIEIRIEGHTSPYWTDAKSELDAYIKNMALSQARARATLEYILNIDSPIIKDKKNFSWLKEKLTANGLSSSRPLKKINTNNIDYSASQRVEFKTLLLPDPKIACKLESFSKNQNLNCLEKIK
ncbi:OmpA family protein [Silvanigrella aquatica]|uniref:Uncharacterized protein n=1 Tax=Silvanigrella aquatica TaxID=1915309 RepID=A0A1L4CXV5_9BACT|nr:OmpA family protein [Silvanigrella aquatica]APJ02778.1 hypothetical protein AXG55_02095 [Silvanigrella aquatica]